MDKKNAFKVFKRYCSISLSLNIIIYLLTYFFRCFYYWDMLHFFWFFISIPKLLPDERGMILFLYTAIHGTIIIVLCSEFLDKDEAGI